MTDLTRRALLATVGGAVGVSIAGCLGGDDDWEMDGTLAAADATQYQGPDCDCCGVYATYLEDHLETDLEVIDDDRLSATKADIGVPRDLGSCHTVVLDGYVFEGHLPVELLDEVLEDQPDLAGIALPGMPSGSPGMGGSKDETWTIYQFDLDGTYDVYTER